MKVTAICLTSDRQAMTDRALRCFLNQTYENKALVILDSGKVPYELPELTREQSRMVTMGRFYDPSITIGELRNVAVEAAGRTDAIVHWDSDDWNAPTRIAMQSRVIDHFRGYQMTGYDDLVFYDTRKKEAWLYEAQIGNGLPGSSLMYLKEVWQQRKFEKTNQGEDMRFQRGLIVKRCSSVPARPLLIATIHGGNTRATPIIPWHDQWTRRTDLDQYCEEQLGH